MERGPKSLPTLSPDPLWSTARSGERGDVSSVVAPVEFRTPEPLSEAIFRHLGRAIVEGRFEPGQRLIEAELCKAFGCSRSPLREAIRMLAAEGLVTLSPRRGARVAILSENTVRDLFEVRLVLESLAVRLAVERASEEQLQELEALKADMRAAVEGGDTLAFFRLNTEFHQAIARIGGNAYLSSLQENAADRSFLPLFMFLSDMGHLQTAVAGHDAIIDAVGRRDAASAEGEMRKHLQLLQKEAERLVVERMGETGRREA
jgi:DNA-binding GntR family transcriptional regulator